ncbi:adenylyl-sulfate kinase [Desulfovibrio litoralis]|uniref:Adenylyl-sulfate kinase n=1 Tax=Desulfovibrio litoralis DSM 11393 TaxID=1121455 RepID=A0A1M7RS47_9BACT|nr:adenylyl-sulfate kinase [Desulfovibrio litoralis]SHN49031.1 adenylylsulfate kinase [Desulfovibrio litoralis DSM 11393]
MTNNKENIHLVAPRSHVSQEMREARHSHKGMVFWLTGLSGAGKSTLAHTAELMLFEKGYNIVVLDGDAIRTGLCNDLCFSPEDRQENNRRIAELAKILVRNATICLCAFISPSETARKNAKDIIGEEFFKEVFISCSSEECERRDVKGFYKKARTGEIKNYTGVSSNYEAPTNPDLIIVTENKTVTENTNELFEFIVAHTKNLELEISS